MTVEVEAASRSEAEQIAGRQWKDAGYILDAENFKGVTFKARLPERERGFAL